MFFCASTSLEDLCGVGGVAKICATTLLTENSDSESISSFGVGVGVAVAGAFVDCVWGLAPKFELMGMSPCNAERIKIVSGDAAPATAKHESLYSRV